MAEEEEDLSKLPLEDKLTHKVMPKLLVEAGVQ